MSKLAWFDSNGEVGRPRRLSKARVMGEVKSDFKVVAKSKAHKLQRGSHLAKPSRPRQDYPKCMKTSSFHDHDNKYKQVRVAMRKF